MKLFSMLLISLLCLGGLTGCEGNGEDMEDTADEIGDDLEDAGDEIEDAFD